MSQEAKFCKEHGMQQASHRALSHLHVQAHAAYRDKRGMQMHLARCLPDCGCQLI